MGDGCIRFWGRSNQNSGFFGNRKTPLTYNRENDVSIFSWFFDLILLQVMRSCLKSQTSSNFGQMAPLTTELQCSCSWGLKNFPLTYEKMVSPCWLSFFIKSSSKLLVTRTGIKACISLILGRIKLLTLELVALVTKISHFWTWTFLKPVDQSYSNFMRSITGVRERLHKVLEQTGSKG